LIKITNIDIIFEFAVEALSATTLVSRPALITTTIVKYRLHCQSDWECNYNNSLQACCREGIGQTKRVTLVPELTTLSLSVDMNRSTSVVGWSSPSGTCQTKNPMSYWWRGTKNDRSCTAWRHSSVVSSPPCEHFGRKGASYKEEIACLRPLAQGPPRGGRDSLHFSNCPRLLSMTSFMQSWCEWCQKC